MFVTICVIFLLLHSLGSLRLISHHPAQHSFHGLLKGYGTIIHEFHRCLHLLHLSLKAMYFICQLQNHLFLILFIFLRRWRYSLLIFIEVFFLFTLGILFRRGGNIVSILHFLDVRVLIIFLPIHQLKFPNGLAKLHELLFLCKVLRS